MKKALKVLALIFVVLFIHTINVLASHTGTVTIDGDSLIQVNDEITLTIRVSNLVGTNTVGSMEGNFIFNNEYFDLISYEAKAPFPLGFVETPNYLRMAGFSNFENDVIVGSGNIAQVVLRAKKEGVTTVRIDSLDVGDTYGDEIVCPQPTKTITIGVNSSTSELDANLSLLGVQGLNIIPVFNPNTTSYSLTVSNERDNINIIGSPSNPNATVVGLGTKQLNEGNNIFNVEVTAEDGVTKKTYTLNITREEDNHIISDDAKLKSLGIQGLAITPTFNSNTTSYSVTVPYNRTSIVLIGTSNDSNAIIVGLGSKQLGVGNNIFNVEVTAEDGVTKKTYTLNVIREENRQTEEEQKSNNSYLENITIDGFDIKFNKNKNNYSLSVPYEASKLNINAVSEDKKSTVEIDMPNILSTEEVNVITIKVTAEDGSIREYTINVERSNYESNNRLSGITIGGGYEITPKFNENTNEYSVNIPENIDKLEIKASTNNPKAEVEIIGNENFKEGKNTVLIKVTDENGFSQYYTLNVNKESKKVRSTILGLDSRIFVLFLLLLLLMFLLFIFLLFNRKKEKEEKEKEEKEKVTIEFKPEINIGSKNQSDDDTVYGGNLHQGLQSINSSEKPKVLINEDPIIQEKIEEAEIEEVITDEVPYDLFDSVVTKDELYDSIKKSMKSKNPKDIKTLKFLLEQEKINRLREELKKENEED